MGKWDRVNWEDSRWRLGAGENPAKGGCYFCAMSKSEPYYSPMIQIDWEGWLTICASCIGEMARGLGWFSPENREKYMLRVQELQKEVAELRPRAEAYDMFLSQHSKIDENTRLGLEAADGKV
jgi:hypothetical protein